MTYPKLTKRFYSLVAVMAMVSIMSACKRDIGQLTDNGLVISSFSILAKDNPGILTDNLSFSVGSDKITGRTAILTSIDSLVPIFTTNADSVTANGKLVKSGQTPVDFTKPVQCILYGQDGSTTQYDVHLTNFTGLPVISIQTKGGQPITSKEAYLEASITINSNGEYPAIEDHVKIKGHGNSTWIEPKKPYKFKFDKKHSLLGMGSGKPWILLANFMDTTAIRNELSMTLGRMSDLDWTPNMRFAELYLNGNYQGTYQLAEQIKINKERVNISDDGYLLEVDSPSRLDADDVFFETDRMNVVIKDPDIDPGSERYNYIKDYINNVENVLYSENFTDPDEGYAKYLDVDSFVDWYLINEIAKNNDAVFFSSCYMNIAPGGKLKMGPVWDFDLAFGNYPVNDNTNPKGLWVKTSIWISRLFEDPVFVEKVKSRFKYFEAQQDAIIDGIELNAKNLRWSVFENNKVWGGLSKDYTSTDAVQTAYNNQISQLEDWLNIRMDWLKDTYEQM